MNTSIRPIRTLLIANRGEIAARIARTCRAMGIRSVAVFSDADQHAPHVQLADTAVWIGASAARDSYLNVQALLDAASKSGADAIHPGYGFLSENAGFAQAVLDAGLIWVGPHPEAIQKMGSKAGAKAIMDQHGVPVIPGYSGQDQQTDLLLSEARRIGFPLLVKASAGGGGKGMVIVREESGLAVAISRAQREALAAFGDNRLILERYFDQARHIEFQIFGDRHGHAIHLFERECSLQRRYQKILEESPSPALTESQRQQMGEAAVTAAKAIGYDNAGTVEFIAMPDGSFYFLEVNTRLQVEHPVTEMITGLDLVREQIQVAEGRPLSWQQADLQQNGYALELRLYAEDTAAGYLPSSGTVVDWKAPELEGFRCDTGVQSGSVIGSDYDPMIAKLIAHAADRTEAFRKMEWALENLVCLGLTTNQTFLQRLVLHPDVQAGEYHTHFLDQNPGLASGIALSEMAARQIAGALSLREHLIQAAQRQQLKNLPSGWRNVPGPSPKHTWIVQGQSIDVPYRPIPGGIRVSLSEAGASAVQTIDVLQQGGDVNHLRIQMDGLQNNWHFAENGQGSVWVSMPGQGPIEVTRPLRFPIAEAELSSGGYLAPIPAEVSGILVEEGQAVKEGDPLVILYSMKMEHTISAEQDGIIAAVHVQTGDRVEAGAVLIQLETQAREAAKTEA